MKPIPPIRFDVLDLSLHPVATTAFIRERLCSPSDPRLFGIDLGDYAYIFDPRIQLRPIKIVDLAGLLLRNGILCPTNAGGEPVAARRGVKSEIQETLTAIMLGTGLPRVASLNKALQYYPRAGRLTPLEPGYDQVSRVISLHPAPLFSEADPTYPHLRTWMSGVPSEQRNLLLGWSITTLCRAYCGSFPHLGISGPKNLGKTRLSEALSQFLHGCSVLAINYTGDEGEMSRHVASVASEAGPTLLLLDNIRFSTHHNAHNEVRSQLLSTAATSSAPSVRKLYTGLVPLNLPLVVLNSVRLIFEPDLRDKVLVVNLRRPEGTRPGDPYYTTPDPLGYAKQHRQELVSEAHHLLTSLDLTPIERPVTRFPIWEMLFTRALGALGLPCPALSHREVIDGSILELANLFDRPGLDVPLVELVRLIQRGNLSNLSSVLRDSRSPTDEGKAKGLFAWVKENVIGEYPLEDGSRVEFTFTNETGRKDLK